jgi:ATP-binding cassette subfamily B protein
MSTTIKTVSYYWQKAWHYPFFVLGLLLAIPVTILVNSFLPPLIMAHVLNRLAYHEYQAHHIWASFGPDLVLYAVLTLSSSVVLWRFVDYCGWKLEGHVDRDIAENVFSHLLKQSADFHANNFGGSLVSQANKLIGSYSRLADTTIFQVLPLLWSLIFVVIILAHSAFLFVLLLLAFSITYIASTFFVTKPLRKLTAKQSNSESKQTGFLADAITNVLAIKSFAGNAYENRRFAGATDETYHGLMDVMRASQRQQFFFGSFVSLISALSLTMAVIGVMVFKADLATVFLILNYTTSILGQLFQFSNSALRNYNRSLGDARDMVEILQVEPEIKDPENPEPVRISKGAIAFKNVSFAHKGSGEEPLFNNLNLEISSGEKIGLVGHSGAGKTTFTKVLLRFSDIDSGEILIDGQNIARISQDDLHQSIAYVPQEPLLFHRPIKENISYGKPNATTKEIEQAAKRANAAGFIEDLPKGYETLVGERGVKLSGGQRQRVAIARAMIKNAPILVLDEATSSLDSESENLIQDALWKLMEGRTAIVIAHRLSTVQRMDRILVLEDGAIVEEGSHKKLLKEKGIYAKLWAHQSGAFFEE